MENSFSRNVVRKRMYFVTINSDGNFIFQHSGENKMPCIDEITKIRDAANLALEKYNQEDIDYINSESEKIYTEYIKNINTFNKTKQKNNDNIGHVYLMGNRRNGYTKIGFTKNQPKFRERTLQSQEPEIYLIASYSGYLKHEEALHNLFSRFRIRGEWFDLNQYSIDSIARLMANPGALI